MILKQFKQIILQGPPGTGKTYKAKRIALNMTGEENPGNRWEIIQFHPSYNYEDFVRGIQIKTKEEQVVYETVDRILVKMAEKASKDKDNNYVLIIDEINRANVAAVLGELIYALEYRGENVSVTYEKDGKAEITLPENLYIIGTMNTADRTIGHIDYAVRRRFAFVTLLPDREVVANQESGITKAVELFYMVAELFEKDKGCISPDYYAGDVAIGHSYFLAKDDEELKAKIQYQVIPILEEYLKDGVLLKSAKDKIEKIKKSVEKSSDGKTPSSRNAGGGERRWKWKNSKHWSSNENLALNRLVLDIVKDYVKNANPQNLAELKKAFPDDLNTTYGIVQDYNDPNLQRHLKKSGKYDRYFVGKNDLIDLPDGMKVMVCNQWSADKNWQRVSQKFKEKLGYEIEKL